MFSLRSVQFSLAAMSKPGRANDAVHMYLSELTARIVADSGTPSDRFHLGKIFLRSFRDDPEFVFQVTRSTNYSLAIQVQNPYFFDMWRGNQKQHHTHANIQDLGFFILTNCESNPDLTSRLGT